MWIVENGRPVLLLVVILALIGGYFGYTGKTTATASVVKIEKLEKQLFGEPKAKEQPKIQQSLIPGPKAEPAAEPVKPQVKANGVGVGMVVSFAK